MSNTMNDPVIDPHAAVDSSGTAPNKAADGDNPAVSALHGARAAVGDVAARAGESVRSGRAAAGDAAQKAGEGLQRGREAAVDAANKGGVAARDAAYGTKSYFEERPLLIGVVGLAAGFALGALIANNGQRDRG